MILNLPNQFVCWRNENGTKVPCDLTGRTVNAHDPSNWMTYEQASASSYGVAFVITENDPWFFLDMDKCYVNGQWTPEASALFQSFSGAWGEISQSNAGLHILGYCDKSKLTDRRNKWDGWKEFYIKDRFVAFGPHGWSRIGGVEQDYDWTDHLLRVVPQREFLGELPEGVDPAYTGPEDDDALITMMKKSSSTDSAFGGLSFLDLWTGNVEKIAAKFPPFDDKGDFDHSSADMALMSHLAFWTGKDMRRMDRLFRRSALMRDKYEKREDYRASTVQKAARLTKRVYDYKPQSQLKHGSLVSVDEIAKAFVRENRECWIHNHHTGEDFAYTGTHWAACEKKELLQSVRCFVNSHVALDRVSKHKPSHWEEVRKAVSIDPEIAKSASDLDAASHFLNLPSGTLDLRSGHICRHQPVHLITQITRVVPEDYRGSRFERFVLEVCGQDRELAEFLKMAFGSCLGELIDDHWFGFIFGHGRNGKSLLIEAVCAALGDYAISIPSAALMSTKNSVQRDVLAQLSGKRLVVSSEVDSGAHFDEPLLKQLTGDEFIPVRPLYKNTYNIRRTFKLFIVGNHRPQIRTDDTAMRSRLKLFEFGQDFSGAKGDEHLRKELFDNLGAVLQWLIDGHASAKRRGKLGSCEHVDRRVQDYFASQATVESWIADRTKKIPDDGRSNSHWEKSSDLYRDYSMWAVENGIEKMNHVRWSEAMIRNGFKKVTSNGNRYVGIELINRPGFPHLRAV